jgi:hypothetical protein
MPVVVEGRLLAIIIAQSISKKSGEHDKTTLN